VALTAGEAACEDVGAFPEGEGQAVKAPATADALALSDRCVALAVGRQLECGSLSLRARALVLPDEGGTIRRYDQVLQGGLSC